MKTFYWLVKREFWEHRGGFFWTPVITTAVLLVLNILGMIAGEIIGGRHFANSGVWHKLATTASPSDLKQISMVLDGTALMPLGIIGLVLFFVLLVYCMKTLSNDRVDRSILFWKSLPVSDLSTVLSKVFSAVVVAPVIAVIVGCIGYLLMLLAFAINASLHGLSFGMVMWGLPHPGHMLASVWGLLPIYMLWMLPSVGWLMMCSAWSSGKVSRWAIALPVAIGVIITWLGAIGTFAGAASWFWKHVVLRLLLSTLPGSWVGNLQDLPHVTLSGNGSGMAIHSYAGQVLDNVGWQYHLLLTPGFLFGILAGAIMIAVAIWLRRWRTEL